MANENFYLADTKKIYIEFFRIFEQDITILYTRATTNTNVYIQYLDITGYYKGSYFSFVFKESIFGYFSFDILSSSEEFINLTSNLKKTFYPKAVIDTTIIEEPK